MEGISLSIFGAYYYMQVLTTFGRAGTEGATGDVIYS
jgi:hypothetical protein